MTLEHGAAERDLAFMRAIVKDSGTYDRNLGLNYIAAGLLYGVQCLATGALLLTNADVPAIVWLMLAAVPTVLFLALNLYLGWRNRNEADAGTASRAIGAAFTGGGVAIALLATIMGIIAYQRADWSIWLLFPIVVCGFQGGIWLAVAIIRRKVSHGIAASGWFATTVILAAMLSEPAAYVTTLGLILILLMTGSGISVLRASTTKH